VPRRRRELAAGSASDGTDASRAAQSPHATAQPCHSGSAPAWPAAVCRVSRVLGGIGGAALSAEAEREPLCLCFRSHSLVCLHRDPTLCAAQCDTRVPRVGVWILLLLLLQHMQG
jgi:hypothetical protein